MKNSYWWEKSLDLYTDDEEEEDEGNSHPQQTCHVGRQGAAAVVYQGTLPRFGQASREVLVEAQLSEFAETRVGKGFQKENMFK